MCACVCVCGHCILAGIIGDLDLFYCTVFIYLSLLTWLCLLPCYCICIALSIPLFSSKPPPIPSHKHKFTHMDTHILSHTTTCTQGLINNFLIDTKWKGSFSFFQHSQTCYRFLSIFNWNPKADDTYAFNFLYAIKYAYLCVYSMNLYRCIMHCLTVLCDPALVCFALPSGSFVVVHNVHGAHWTHKIQT